MDFFLLDDTMVFSIVNDHVISENELNHDLSHKSVGLSMEDGVQP